MPWDVPRSRRRMSANELEAHIMKKYSEGQTKRAERNAGFTRSKEQSKSESKSSDTEETDGESSVDAPVHAPVVKVMKAMKAKGAGSKAKKTKLAKAKSEKLKVKAEDAKPHKAKREMKKETKARPDIPNYGKKPPPCPKKGDGPIDYKQGRIYTSIPKMCFRVIRLRGLNKSERMLKWGDGKKPQLKAWKEALKKIDEYDP